MQQVGYGPSQAAQIGLSNERKQRPRQVYEDPKLYVFESVNFTLLVKIFSQVAGMERAAFISGLLHFVRQGVGAQRHKGAAPFPSFQGYTSALPLIAEFCVRTGYLKELLAATQVPTTPSIGLAVMMRELEEMIALNFNLLSDAELAEMPAALGHLREVADRQTYSARGTPGRMLQNPHYRQGFSDEGNEIRDAIDGITEECRKARFWYLKGALQELPNVEIESDRVKVEDFLSNLGFSADMIKALNAAESDYKSTATAFELKNCLGHLRSFIEHLHRESAKAVAQASGQTIIDRWGDATLYLRQQGFFSKQHENFVTSLYTLLSDESVHPLTAEREYARLLRNVVIEYGVMFLTVLDKKRVKI